jgi:hypothetical protein
MGRHDSTVKRRAQISASLGVLGGESRQGLRALGREPESVMLRRRRKPDAFAWNQGDDWPHLVHTKRYVDTVPSTESATGDPSARHVIMPPAFQDSHVAVISASDVN